MALVDEQQRKGKVLRGTVVSDKPKGSIVVLVERYVKHSKYGKYVRKQKRYMVDDPENTYAVGNTVTIVEVRPISKTKHFRIVS